MALVQDAVRNKQVKLKKIDGATNVSDMGTKPLEPKRHLELLKQLPLAPPHCRRFIAVLAALSAAETGEASQAVEVYGIVRQTSYAEQVCSSSGIYLMLLMVVLITFGAVRLYDWVRGIIGREEKRFNSVGSQTQTTYTEVRGAARPRFMVLPEHSHG